LVDVSRVLGRGGKAEGGRLMARKATGQVVVRERKDGRVYALRFRANGERQYLTLGTDAEGWDRKRAEAELETELAKVKAGVWRPARPEPAPTMKADPTFHEFASEWFAAKQNEIRPNTVSSYRNDLTNHLLPFFAEHSLSQITIVEVDRYRNTKVREGKLKPRSINMHLALLAQILEVAVEYELIARNPASGRRRRLKATRPRPVHLDTAERLAVMLEAATLLDHDDDARTVGRRAAVAVMLFACVPRRSVRSAGGTLTSRTDDCTSGARRPRPVCARSTCCPSSVTSSRRSRRGVPLGRTTSCS
jgi:integrase